MVVLNTVLSAAALARDSCQLLLRNEESDEEELNEDSRDQQQLDLFNTIASQSQSESYADDAVQEHDDDIIILPAHQRCASHTLNLVGCSSHPQAAKLNAKYRSLMHIPQTLSCQLFGIKLTVRSQMRYVIQLVLDQLVTTVQTR